jgi:hypothetical protein
MLTLSAVVAPWELEMHLPWQVFTSPLEKWALQPSFVVGEYLFYALALLGLVHAWRQGEGRRRHLLAWIGALLAGTANDMFFMALPLVDNFWQAQATIMITPRLPLYIPCVYICFMYYATVSVWRLGLPQWSRAALTGLAAAVFYGPYDVVGAKFSWWTWHDSDLPISHRLLGAPIGSTMWIIMFTATFAWFIGRAVDRDPALSGKSFARGLAMACGLSTLTFMVQITAVQQLDGGIPGPVGLATVVLVYGALVARGWARRQPRPANAADRLLNAAAVVYFAALVAIMAAFSPETHRNTSMHQTYGACHVEATDIAGLTRYQYLCAEDFDEDFTFACPELAGALPAAGSEWYTVCGRPHTDFPRWLLGVGAFGIVGVLLYSYLLGGLRRGARKQ